MQTAALAELLRRLAVFIDENRALIDAAIADAKERPPTENSLHGDHHTDPTIAESEAHPDPPEAPADATADKSTPTQLPALIPVGDAIARLTLANGVVGRPISTASDGAQADSRPSNPLLERFEPIEASLSLCISGLKSLIQTRERPKSISATRTWDGLRAKIAREHPTSWLVDPRVTDNLTRERLKALARRYQAGQTSVARLCDLLERHPALARMQVPAALRHDLTKRLQAVAISQAGIRTEIDLLRADSRQLDSCPVQDQLFLQLRWLVDRDALGIYLESMTRNSIVQRAETETLLAEMEAEHTREAKGATGRRDQDLAPAAVGSGRQDRFPSVLAAFQAARDEFGGIGSGVVFTDHAAGSAEDSPFLRPDDVHDAFRALWTAVQEWRRSADGGMGITFKELLRQQGYDEKRCSGTAIGNSRSEYTMPFRGRIVEIDLHMTLGSGNPNTCLSIHWWRDEHTRELVVAHCGRHLSNTLT